MRILIVEDDLNKLKQISNYLREEFKEAELIEKKSHQTGLKSALEDSPDLIILDMSMPTFELSTSESGGTYRHYAGRDMLKEIKRRSLQTQVIVVTMYESFGEGDDVLSLDELKMELEDDFSDYYIDTVFYQPATSGWKNKLSDAISKLSE